MQFWLILQEFPSPASYKDVLKYFEMDSSCWVKSSCKFSWFTVAGKNTLAIWCKIRRHTSVQLVLFALQCFWIVHFWRFKAMRLHPGEKSLSCVDFCPESTCSLCVKMALLSSEQLCSLWSPSPQNPQVCPCSLLLLVRTKNPATLFSGHVLHGKTTGGIFSCSW